MGRLKTCTCRSRQTTTKIESTLVKLECYAQSKIICLYVKQLGSYFCCCFSYQVSQRTNKVTHVSTGFLSGNEFLREDLTVHHSTFKFLRLQNLLESSINLVIFMCYASFSP
jgi:hypothetical protein